MKVILNTTLSILTIVVLVLLSTTCIDIGLQIEAARNFHDATIQRIQASKYSEYVIEQCYQDASRNDYELFIENIGLYDEISDYYVKMDYHIALKLFNQSIVGTVEGYAR